MSGDDFKDEIWVTRDGREILVGDMTEEHVRNTLRMIIRVNRERRERSIIQLIGKIENIPDEWEHERPDNPTILAGLRARHGDAAVRVERASAAGMDGGDVYVNGKKIGWFGGI